MNMTYTHPDVFTRGVEEGWADPEVDPTQIDWTARRAAAALPFPLVDGRPVNPCAPTGIRHGRNELGHWGEQLCADAIVTAHHYGGRCVLLVERTDGHGWAFPGGYVEPGEDPVDAAARELREETGLTLDGVVWRALPARVVPDPRASDEAWMVTTPALAELGDLAELPRVVGADDARRAAWVSAASYDSLAADLATTYQARVFPAHVGMLQDLLG